MILEALTIDAAAFEARTGWAIEPQGACKGEVCVPLPHEARVESGPLDVEVVAQRLGMPLVYDEAQAVWSLGPETSVTGRVLSTAEAPDLILPDAHGNPFRLSSLHGEKVLLVAWASW
jgi:hypothetical protein